MTGRDMICFLNYLSEGMAGFPKSRLCQHKNDIIMEIWEGFEANTKKSFPNLQVYAINRANTPRFGKLPTFPSHHHRLKL